MTALQARRFASGALQRRDRGGVGIDREDLASRGEAQREGAGAAEEIGDAPRAFQALQRSLGERLFARHRRLQKPAGRRRTRASPNAICGARRSITISP